MSDERKPLLEHLGDLRKRIILCLLAVALGMIACYALYDIVLLDFIRAPIDVLSGREGNPFARLNPLMPLFKFLRIRLDNPDLALHYIGPLEGFTVKLKLSLFAGVILALPFVILQIWKFISAALTRKERRSARIFFPVSILLFLTGLLFAYLIMLPLGLYFLTSISNDLVPMITISKYATIVYMLMFIFGLVFELPLMILFLTSIGIVTPKFLAEKRKFAILLMFALAAVLTPPDVFTQVMLAVPVILLYEISIWISKAAYRRRSRS